MDGRTSRASPPPAPRSRRPSSPLALGRSGRSVRQLAAPRPARGGPDYPAKPSERIIEYCGRVRSRAPFSASLLYAPAGARSLITLRSIESREHSYASRSYAGAPSLEAHSLRCSSLRASSLVAPMLRTLYARRLPALYLATHRKFNRIGRTFLAPARPPLAPVRPCPYA